MNTNCIEYTDDEIVKRAIDIVAKRVTLPVERHKPLKLQENGEWVRELRQYLALNMANRDVEHFVALYFTPDGRLIKMAEIAKGDEKSVSPEMREIARQGLLCNATFACVAHNHPNWDKRPSPADEKSAMATMKLLHAVGIDLMYAFVVGGPTVDDVVPIEPPREPEVPDFLKALIGNRT